MSTYFNLKGFQVHNVALFIDLNNIKTVGYTWQLIDLDDDQVTISNSNYADICFSVSREEFNQNFVKATKYQVIKPINLKRLLSGEYCVTSFHDATTIVAVNEIFYLLHVNFLGSLIFNYCYLDTVTLTRAESLIYLKEIESNLS